MNYALIAIGCRNKHLNYKAIQVAKNIGNLKIETGSNYWMAPNAIKMLTSEKVQKSIAG